MESVSDQRKTARQSALTVLFFLLVIAAELLLVFGKSLDHDEHQFVASGALLARRGLLPYRDYPYFHTPNLSFVYALLFKMSSHLLLSARLFNAACAIGLAGAIFIVAGKCFAFLSAGGRLVLSMGAVLLCFSNPLFTQTSGRAWNHDFPALLCVGAFLAACAAQKRHPTIWSLATGLLLGTAIGTRLTFAPTILVFAAMLLRSSAKGQATPIAARHDDGLALRGSSETSCLSVTSAIAQLAPFLCGLLLGVVPTLAFLIISPRQFIFGNFQYPVLNTAFRMAGQHHHEFNTGIGSHLWYVVLHFVLQPGTLLLLALLFLSLWVARRSGSDEYRLQRTYLPLLLLFLLPGALAPTPAFAQYFFVLVPFVVLWIVYALAAAIQLSDAGERHFSGEGVATSYVSTLPRLEYESRLHADQGASFLKKGLVASAVFAGICIIAGVPTYNPEKHWTLTTSAPLRVHREGVEIAHLSGPGTMLTLTPIYPLEGGCDIYEAYATGPFAARIAPMLSEEQLQSIHLYNDGQLLVRLRQHPPAAVLAGSEGDTDQPMRAYACKNPQWQPVRIAGLWLWAHQSAAASTPPTTLANHD